MSTFKKTKVVMLPTNEKAIRPLIVNPSIGRDGKMEIPRHQHNYPAGDYQKAGYKTFHLYFLSDEEIKEGDWFLMNGCIIRQCKSTNKEPYTIHTVVDTTGGIHHVSVCEKVIATTDNSLEKICEYESGTWLRLPQPSQSFIEVFVKEYNKGNVITEVMVEYNLMNKGYDKPEDYPYQECEILKVNPKDNTITIRKVKDSWNRDEVMKFGNWCRIHDSKFPNQVWTIQQLFDKWFEENL